MKQKMSMIWNVSLICPWDCKICCVDATSVTTKREDIKIKTEGLTKKEIVKRNKQVSIYDQALKVRQERG